jgi:hypothetical protein
MKRIIMKTLSECFYFKKLEEDSPVAFKSLTEKLKYLHDSYLGGHLSNILPQHGHLLDLSLSYTPLKKTE